MAGVCKPLADRFWPKVDRRGPDECWPWKAARRAAGYGKIGRGKSGRGWMLAHRASWELAHGPISSETLVLHRCDNPPCVNPAHLFLGTHADNVHDMVAKGRCYQQLKTHCPRGHPYSAENTYERNGGRSCRACNVIAVAAYRTRKTSGGAK